MRTSHIRSNYWQPSPPTMNATMRLIKCASWTSEVRCGDELPAGGNSPRASKTRGCCSRVTFRRRARPAGPCPGGQVEHGGDQIDAVNPGGCGGDRLRRGAEHLAPEDRLRRISSQRQPGRSLPGSRLLSAQSQYRWPSGRCRRSWCWSPASRACAGRRSVMTCDGRRGSGAGQAGQRRRLA